jgi:hypothetical protein
MVRRKSFDAILHITQILYLLNEESLHSTAISHFVEKLAKSLGFDSMKNLHQVHMEHIILSQKMKKLEIELKANAGWGFFPTEAVPRIQKNLEEAKTQKKQIEANIQVVKDRLSAKNFTALKNLLQNEQPDVKENSQMITLISSMATIVNQVDMMQKESFAARLLSKYLDDKASFPPKIKPFWQELIANQDQFESILQFQDAIQQAIALVNEMLTAAQNKKTALSHQKETNL